MTTILITTELGKWDEAYKQLKRSKLILTPENTVQVEHSSAAQMKKVLFELWNLTAAQVIAGFAIESDGIRAKGQE